ncbi:nitroreductase family protein [Actinosynnema sp. NPDC047251]|uniref:Nitroreductase n=1 Tax=Saccharothrix espanaensis (strain ATCC 51144 / DSM 44229 / JCM 9112 / NBRC 15066 / NRRL 15764) TaxID=1179773 RepID=K0JNQ3_SACES|nr:nitroreductase family protein [Saccharothrix espanaensis]CCH27585.1 Nitroreductase [Saccharothrix espanaensis DSM 44229]
MKLNPIIADRWSPRAFDATATVAPADLTLLLEAARWAPSHGNTQPARFVVGLRGDDTFQRIFDVLRPGNQTWAGRASVLLLAARATADERGPVPNTEFGLGLAVQNLVLQAVDLGLVTHQMGGFDHDAAARAFALPEDVVPVVVIAVGKLGDVSVLPEELQARETRPRERKPLPEIAFTGTWGKAFEV